MSKRAAASPPPSHLPDVFGAAGFGEGVYGVFKADVNLGICSVQQSVGSAANFKEKVVFNAND